MVTGYAWVFLTAWPSKLTCLRCFLEAHVWAMGRHHVWVVGGNSYKYVLVFTYCLHIFADAGQYQHG
eukprot:6042106-Amphidinium_carterae.1